MGVETGDMRLVGWEQDGRPVGLTTHHVGPVSGYRKTLSTPPTWSEICKPTEGFGPKELEDQFGRRGLVVIFRSFSETWIWHNDRTRRKKEVKWKIRGPRKTWPTTRGDYCFWKADPWAQLVLLGQDSEVLLKIWWCLVQSLSFWVVYKASCERLWSTEDCREAKSWCLCTQEKYMKIIVR